jgi:DNA modification methylase
MEWLVRTYSARGDVLLESFVGFGSTLLAAHNHCRRATGIELNEAYCEITVYRLQK